MWKEFFSDAGLSWSPVDNAVNSILKSKDQITYECTDGVDNDGDGAVDLADQNCAGRYDASESGPPTECNDGIDNDGDGGIDYLGVGGWPADLSCTSSQVSKESDGTPRLCQNNKDDDGDGLIDAADPGCADPQDNTENDGTTQCQDGFDNDGDGAVDSSDPGCLDSNGKYQRTAASEDRGKKPQCSDGIDNDGDGGTDWPSDFNCASPTGNAENGPLPQCANKKDDDKDGAVDAADPDCANAGDNSEAGGKNGALQPACSDGADNDGDGARDYPADKGCINASDADEGDSKATCQNGLDDDGDGFTDYPADLGCLSSQGVKEDATKQQCQNGKDDDGDGLVDMKDPGCSGTQDNTENSASPVCKDGRDNDGDGAVDYPADVGCSSPQDTNEADITAQCQNGKDDDGDGAVDYPADRGCASLQGNAEQNPDPKKRLQCENGIDDDKDGFVDLADPACDSAQDDLEAGITESAKEEQLGKYLTDYVKSLVDGTKPLPPGQAPLMQAQKSEISKMLSGVNESPAALGTCYGQELQYAREFAQQVRQCTNNNNLYDDAFLSCFWLGVPGYTPTGCNKKAQDWLKNTYGISGSQISAGAQKVDYNLVFYFTDKCESVTDPSLITSISRNCEGKLLADDTFFWYGSPISLIWDNGDAVERPTPTLVNFPLALDQPGTYWVWRASGQAPLLVYDPEHTGRITSAAQLFGHWSFGGQRLASLAAGAAQPWPHGYAPLATLDADGNAEISGEELRDLGLWFNANQNGISESGEVQRIAVTGVTHLYLPQNPTYDPSRDIEVVRGYRRELNGAVIYGRSVDWTARGNTGAAAIMGAGISGGVEPSWHGKEVEAEPASEGLSRETIRAMEARVRGGWSWKMRSVAGIDPQHGGMLLFDFGDGEARKGFAMTDAQLEGSGTIGRIGLREGFTWSITGVDRVEFVVVKTPSTVLRNTARISADGTTMEGETVGEKRGQPTLRYRWIAFKEKAQ